MVIYQLNSNRKTYAGFFKNPYPDVYTIGNDKIVKISSKCSCPSQKDDVTDFCVFTLFRFDFDMLERWWGGVPFVNNGVSGPPLHGDD